MSAHITKHREGFSTGYTRITAISESNDDTGIELGVLRLRDGQVLDESVEIETAWLLMNGSVRLTLGDRVLSWSRASLFDESGSCVHAARGESVTIEALGDAELAVLRVDNRASFATETYAPGTVQNEHRGLGQVANACYRFVRTIFDDTNSSPEAQLVLGEVVTMPGRWSSYPPHHHPQPELYHYRFTLPQGYGHAEVGDDVFKVRQGDTVKIAGGKDHAQAAAPGYGMYYIWVIRHLQNARYDVPEFCEEHRWTMQDGASFWWPSDAVGTKDKSQ